VVGKAEERPEPEHVAEQGGVHRAPAHPRRLDHAHQADQDGLAEERRHRAGPVRLRHPGLQQPGRDLRQRTDNREVAAAAGMSSRRIWQMASFFYYQSFLRASSQMKSAT